MKILLISGSPRANSNSRKVIDHATNFLKQREIAFDLFDVHTDRLPMMDSESETFDNPQVKRLRTLAKEVDSFFICTPEYHGGMSGALKNAIDFLNNEYFQQKPVAIAATTGGGKGGINALNNLRIAMRAVSALTTINQVAVDPKDITETGLALYIQERLDELLDELVLFTRKQGAQ